ncbi:hypothetical protein CEP51_003227 [Fusarium floridanum]|uniref:Uncharacterized protein n=1 Tax=Fusarium floridanum TaxID=1325733 RepID=A0A428S7Y0_9HYPO|nr:hypothetical protein CEP51_003227 [Fusarium floridanum]
MLLSTYLTVPFLRVAQASVGNVINIDFTVWKNGHVCQGKESLNRRVGYGSCITVGADALPAWDSFRSGGLSGGGFIPDPAEFLFYEKASRKASFEIAFPSTTMQRPSALEWNSAVLRFFEW